MIEGAGRLSVIEEGFRCFSKVIFTFIDTSGLARMRFFRKKSFKNTIFQDEVSKKTGLKKISNWSCFLFTSPIQLFRYQNGIKNFPTILQLFVRRLQEMQKKQFNMYSVH